MKKKFIFKVWKISFGNIPGILHKFDKNKFFAASLISNEHSDQEKDHFCEQYWKIFANEIFDREWNSRSLILLYVCHIWRFWCNIFKHFAILPQYALILAVYSPNHPHYAPMHSNSLPYSLSLSLSLSHFLSLHSGKSLH